MPAGCGRGAGAAIPFKSSRRVTHAARHHLEVKVHKYLVANATLFGYLFIYSNRYNMGVDEEEIDSYNISVGVY